MENFDLIFVRHKKTGELVNIVDLSKKEYEQFLDTMNELRIAYTAIKNKK